MSLHPQSFDIGPQIDVASRLTNKIRRNIVDHKLSFDSLPLDDHMSFTSRWESILEVEILLHAWFQPLNFGYFLRISLWSWDIIGDPPPHWSPLYPVRATHPQGLHVIDYLEAYLSMQVDIQPAHINDAITELDCLIIVSTVHALPVRIYIWHMARCRSFLGLTEMQLLVADLSYETLGHIVKIWSLYFTGYMFKRRRM